METKTYYAIVGTTVTFLAVGLAAFVVFIASNSLVENYKRYWIDFSGSVSGLRPGSVVSYRGINVGQVVDLRIKPDNVEEVRVTIEIDANTPVKSDTVASQEIQSIAGGATVQLSGGTQAAALIAEPVEGFPIIPSKPSQLEEFLTSAPELVTDIRELIFRVKNLVGPTNQQNIAQILENAQVISGSLARSSGEVDGLIADVQQTLTSLKSTAERIDQFTAATEQDIKSLLDGTSDAVGATSGALNQAAVSLAAIESAAATIENAAAQLDGLIAENRLPIRDFTRVTLYDANAFIAELRELVVSLRQVATDLNRDPSGFFLGNQQRGYDAR